MFKDCSADSAEAFVSIELTLTGVHSSVLSQYVGVTFRIWTETTKRPNALSSKNASLLVVQRLPASPNSRLTGNDLGKLRGEP